MSFYTPNTAVYLCNVPINSNQKNQFVQYTSGNSVWNAEGQRNWFLNQQHLKHTFTDFTYQRKDKIIRVPINAEVLFADGSNYVVYQNKHYNGKWFYCFITKIEFINENMTALHIKTDVFQTWFFEMYKNNHMDINFIARETVIKDEIFKHTLPENLPTGELTETHRESITPNLSAKTEDEFNNNYYIMVMSNDVIPQLGDYTQGQNCFTGGIPNGCYMYAVDLNNLPDLVQYISDPNAHDQFNLKIDSIIEMIAIPKFMATFQNLTPQPTPPTPVPPSTTNYLGSPYASGFKISQIYNPSNNHYGQDIIGITDKNIYATHGGEVVDARWQNDYDHNRGYGKLVRIYDANSGLYYIYGHLSAWYVAVGDIVEAGQCIGLEGETGNADGSHVHYQVSECLNGNWNEGTRNPSDFASYPNQEGTYEP